MFMSDRNMCDIIIVILMYRATSEKEFTLNVHKKLIKTNKKNNKNKLVVCDAIGS